MSIVIKISAVSVAVPIKSSVISAIQLNTMVINATVIIVKIIIGNDIICKFCKLV
jgi:hypothetical protein